MAELDRLEQMLEDQWELQAKAFGHHFDIMNPDQRKSFIKDMVLSATHELHEALDETAWKSWRGGNHIFLDQFLNELVDAQLLLFNLFLATGLNPDEVSAELAKRVALKQKLNVQRQESGYAV